MIIIPHAPLTVSQLNKQIKHYLEEEIGDVQVEGEISNLTKPSSGHYYFTLKDKQAQIRCVFFKNRHHYISTPLLQDGQQVIATGKLSLYEARGDYQLIVEQIKEAGLGTLYQQFEALKKQLEAEGLFSPTRKKNLPLRPHAIGIITSPSGAAIQDMLSTLARRYPLTPVFIYPSEVQGINAPQQLIQALERANREKRCDVLILARGGGSMEDLWAFNNERLARQIGQSNIPIVSGIGHETDFTIADFVADYRAETPTAAAVAVTPDKKELFNSIHRMEQRLHTFLLHLIHAYQIKLSHLLHKISSPGQTIIRYWQQLDYLTVQLESSCKQIVQRQVHRLALMTMQLSAFNPQQIVQQRVLTIQQIIKQLTQQISIKINQLRHQLHNNLSTLHVVSPLATLDRGYAIATYKNKVLYNTKEIELDDKIGVRLAKGKLVCIVSDIQKD